MTEDELRNNLRTKGWKENEIDNALNIMYDKEPEYKDKDTQKNNLIVYLTSLIITVIGNIVLALFMAPLIIIIKSLWIYVVIAVIGFIFGVLYNSILKDIKKVEKKNYLVSEIIIPALALITVLIITNIASTLSIRLRTPIIQNPRLIAMVYFLAFVSPLLFEKVKEYQKKKIEKKILKQ